MTSQRYTTRHSDVEGFDSLAELALDMRWSWNHSADLVWRQLDPDLWELTHNPWAVLQTVARDRILEAFSDPSFRKDVARLLKEKKKSTEAPAWFQITYPASAITTVAYFSMEFMLSEALPIYSGGLGNVAGDQLKAASDLGVPVVGVGLLYNRATFAKSSTKREINGLFTHITTRAVSRLPPFVSRAASGSGCPLTCRRQKCGSGSGKSRSEG